MKNLSLFVLLSFITACAGSTQTKRYEDYFQPIKEEKGYIIYRPFDTVPENISNSPAPAIIDKTPTQKPQRETQPQQNTQRQYVIETQPYQTPPAEQSFQKDITFTVNNGEVTPNIPKMDNYEVRHATPDDMAKAAPQTICGVPLHGTKKVGSPYMIAGVMYYPLESADGYAEEGIASWYGPGFHGELTANGEVYDQKAMTAAHKTLPIPSLVRVKNLENGKEVIVRINDRGPFAKGRIIDLSEAAATQLDMTDKGTARVHISVLSENSDCYVIAGKEIDINKGNFAVQIGAFIDPANAEDLALRMGNNAAVNVAEIEGRTWNRVIIKGFTNRWDAVEAIKRFSKDFPGAFVVRY